MEHQINKTIVFRMTDEEAKLLYYELKRILEKIDIEEYLASINELMDIIEIETNVKDGMSKVR